MHTLRRPSILAQLALLASSRSASGRG
jgi:hypothetical protein